jgi:hypothetical protein
MVEAFFNQLAHRKKAEAVSVGTEPCLREHPAAPDVIVLARSGLI